MGRLSALFLVFALGAACAVALASCGGEDADLLPGTSADQIESNLTRVEELADEGNCVGAEEAVAEVAAEVEELREVDLKLKAALQEGTTKLSEVVGRCEEETDEEAEPSLDPDVEAEETEDEKKPKKEKSEDDEESSEPKEESTETDEGQELPPSNGQGEENGEGAPPIEEPEEAPPSGGVGPGVGVE